MARPVKIGLDYFPMDVDFFSDIKIRKLIKYQGGKAISVYTYLLCIIYKDGYYIKWDDELPFIISETTGFDEAYIHEVLRCCFNIGIFNKELHQSEKIITSKGIQERYEKIRKLTTRKTKILRYSLINDEETEVNSIETQVKPKETPITPEPTNDKEGKKDTKKVTPKKKDVHDAYSPIVDYWLKEFHPDFTFKAMHGGKVKSIIKQLEDILKKSKNPAGPDDVVNAFKLICERMPEWYRTKDLQVIDGSLNSIISEIKTLEQNGKGQKLNRKEQSLKNAFDAFK